MKLLKLLFLLILLLLIFFVFFLGYLGFVPGLSSILGTDKPKNLGIKYNQADLKSVRSKSQLEYKVLPDNPSPALTRQFTGKRNVTAQFTSAEITATMNNQPWKYWPYKDVQVKFNSDGSGEISGIFLKDRLIGYGSAINAPSEAIQFATKFLPSNPVFYIKLKASLVNNKIDVFKPQAFEIGRMPMPLSLFLSFGGFNLVQKAYGQNPQAMSEELSKVQNKRQLIIDFINSELSSDFGDFYAKSAYFGNNKLFFDGTLTESISYTP
jgi:hypothetical protein